MEIGDYVIVIKHFCDGEKGCIVEGEIGEIYNMDDYPDFTYIDFNGEGLALSQREINYCVKLL